MNPSLTSRSPDDHKVVEVIENYGRLDRNFDIWLTVDGNRRLLFTSPDEGRPPTEECIWSKKSDAFEIVSGSVVTIEGAPKVGSKVCYLLYSVAEDRIYCNASQGKAGLPTYDFEMRSRYLNR